MFPEEVKATISKDHLYTAKLFELVEFDVTSLRKINVALLVLGSGLLSFGVWKFCVKECFVKNSSWLILASFVSTIIISQMPSLWIERVPAYNNWASFFSISVIGIFFIWICSNQKSIFFILIIGILISISIFIRPPSGISLLIFITLLTLICKKRNKRFIIFLCSGLLIGSIMHFSIIESPERLIDSTKKGVLFHSYLMSNSQEFILLRYFKEIWGTLKFSLAANKFELLGFFIAYFWLLKKGKRKYLPFVFYISFIFLSLNHYYIGDIKGAHGLYWLQWRYYFVQIISFSLFLLIHLMTNENNIIKLASCRHFLLAFMLIVSPFLFACGTSNIIMFNMNFFTCLFVVGVLILFLMHFSKNEYTNSSCHLYLLLFLLSAGPAHAYLKGRFDSSFYTICEASHGDFRKHDQLVKIHGQKLYVNASIQDLCLNLNTALSNYKKDLKYLINFSSMPGLNFLTALPHPIQSWTIHMKDNFTLENIDRASFHKSAILIRSNDTEVIGQLTKCFPNWNISHNKKFTIDYRLGSKTPQLLLFIPNDIEK